ncbi:14969_t:CDS:2, partial [Acaulospora colombiana]
MCVYLNSLDEQERLELNSSLEPYDIHLPKVVLPLFHYPALLKKFSFMDVEMMLFLRCSSGLRSFKLDKYLGHSDIPDCDRIFDLGAQKSSLSNISSLEIDYTLTPIMKNSTRILN